MLMKICPHCGKHIPAGATCPCWGKRTKEARRRYDTGSRDEKRKAFYHSRAWAALRQSIKTRANGLDEVAWSEGRIEQGTTAHHIEPLEERPDLGLDPTNIVWISAHTHKNIHREYRKSRQAKEAAQRRLRAIVDRKWISGQEGAQGKV